MAIGRIVGGVAGLGLVGASYLGVAGQDETVRDQSGAVVEAGEVGAFRIRLGDCMNDPAEDEFESVEGVPCSVPHDSEVFHAFNLTGGLYPGPTAVSDQAGAGCFAAFEGFVGVSYEQSVLDFGWITPTEGSWVELEDREVLCVMYDANGLPLTGSARDSRR